MELFLGVLEADRVIDADAFVLVAHGFLENGESGGRALLWIDDREPRVDGNRSRAWRPPDDFDLFHEDAGGL